MNPEMTATDTPRPARRLAVVRVVAGLCCAAALIGAAWPEPLSTSATLAWTGLRSGAGDLGAHEAWTLLLFGVGMFVAGRSLRRRSPGQ